MPSVSSFSIISVYYFIKSRLRFSGTCTSSNINFRLLYITNAYFYLSRFIAIISGKMCCCFYSSRNILNRAVLIGFFNYERKRIGASIIISFLKVFSPFSFHCRIYIFYLKEPRQLYFNLCTLLYIRFSI